VQIWAGGGEEGRVRAAGADHGREAEQNVEAVPGLQRAGVLPVSPGQKPARRPENAAVERQGDRGDHGGGSHAEDVVKWKTRAGRRMQGTVTM